MKRLEWSPVILTSREVEVLGREVLAEMLRDWRAHLEENPEIMVESFREPEAAEAAYKCADGEVIYF
jgi:hypothetical protein